MNEYVVVDGKVSVGGLQAHVLVDVESGAIVAHGTPSKVGARGNFWIRRGRKVRMVGVTPANVGTVNRALTQDVTAGKYLLS